MLAQLTRKTVWDPPPQIQRLPPAPGTSRARLAVMECPMLMKFASDRIADSHLGEQTLHQAPPSPEGQNVVWGRQKRKKNWTRTGGGMFSHDARERCF